MDKQSLNSTIQENIHGKLFFNCCCGMKSFTQENVNLNIYNHFAHI